MTSFDHIEVHVNNINNYIDFLKKLFDGGESKVLSENGTSMFKSPEGLFIELKKRKLSLIQSYLVSVNLA